MRRPLQKIRAAAPAEGLRKAAISLASALALIALPAPAAAPKPERCVLPNELKTLWPNKDEVRFAPTTLHERQVFTTLLPALVAAAQVTEVPPQALEAQARQAGFTLQIFRAEGETFWALKERPEARRGAGAYVFRTLSALDVAVQSPHAYFDLGTGVLGAELFFCAPQGSRPRAFFTNTAHRFKGRPNERRADPDHPADVAHNGDHLFQIATDLLVRTLPGLKVIQLHGFGESDRKSRRNLAAVVSAGSEDPQRWVRSVALRLADVLGDGVRLFPDQTAVLGGTRNAQARLLQSYPEARFVHLELSSRVRRELRDRERLHALAAALFKSGEE